MSQGNEVIFISYRRAESEAVAKYLTEELDHHFGPGTTFRDTAGLAGGEEFPQALQFALERSLLLLVVVGPNWATELTRRRQLGQGVDYVADELRRSRKLGIPVIPVLVEGARMPVATELPEDLQFFTSLHALPLGTPNGDSAGGQGLPNLLTAVSKQTRLPDLATGNAVSWVDRASRQLVTSPAELMLNPRRFLLRHSRDGWRDLTRLALYIAVLSSAAASIWSFGVGMSLETVIAGLPMLVPAILLGLLLPTALYAAIIAQLTRMVTGVRAYQRMFLIIGYIRGTLATASLAIGGLCISWLGSDDHTMVIWRAELIRAQSPTDMIERIFELQHYASESTLSLVISALGVSFLLVAIWSYFAWNTLRATHHCGRALPLALLVFTLGVEIALPVTAVLLPNEVPS